MHVYLQSKHCNVNITLKKKKKLLYLCYSVELDFKLQEDKLQPLMKRLCPLDSQCPALPYSNEVFTTTPKRKSKTESKKHARWKLWFLWTWHAGFGDSLFSGCIHTPAVCKMDGVLRGSNQQMRMDNYRIQFIWVSELRLLIMLAGRQQWQKTFPILPNPFLACLLKRNNVQLQKPGKLWDSFSVCIC